MSKFKPLTIVMAVEFFHPFARGGSEWSTYILAKALQKKGHQVIILTPNYGSSLKTWHGLQIVHFPLGKKLSSPDDPITPFWHTNPFWIVSSTIALITAIHKFRPQIIHIQGKYFLPAAGIAKILTRTPTIITLRDYQTLCNLGLCLWHKNRRCTPKEFFNEELKTYHQQYPVTHSFLRSVLGRLTSIWLRQWLHLVNQIICVSKKQAQIFAANGIKSQVIYNTTDFSESTHNTKYLIRNTSYVLFVGRLTPGKGAHLLLPIFARISQQFPQYTLKIIGTGFLQSKLHQQTQDLHLEKNIIFVPHASHSEVLTSYQQAAIIIVPSLWPEPFGRVALEAIAAGTPTVTSNRGGLPEIVQGKYGLSVTPTAAKIAQAVIKVLKNYHSFTSHIKKDQLQLRRQFERGPVKKYLSLYEQLSR